MLVGDQIPKLDIGQMRSNNHHGKGTGDVTDPVHGLCDDCRQGDAADEQSQSDQDSDEAGIDQSLQSLQGAHFLFGSAVAEVLSGLGTGTKRHRIGINDFYCIEVGSQKYLRKQVGINAEGIINKVKEVISE